MRSSVATLWAEPAAPNPPPLRWPDVALGAIELTGVLAEAVLRGDLQWRPVAIAFGCGLVVALLFRRSHPLAVVAYSFGGFAVLSVAASMAGAEPVMLYSGAVVLVFAYALFRWGAGRDVIVGFGVMVLAFVTIVGTDYTGAEDAVGGAAVLLCASASGTAVRYRAISRRHLVEQAQLQEREQLARDLHDTVAHHVSAIAIQAQAGLFLARSASLGGATDALEVIDREAAQTLAEMRTIVGVLRDRQSRSAVAPPRCLDDIRNLTARSSGDLRIDVDLRGHLTNLAPALEAALYRVAQESVTNAERHAHHATRVQVTVTGGAKEVQLTVVDDGHPTPAAPIQSGYGLIGMTERAELLGGTLTAGPSPGRGWAVRAVLPCRGGAA